MEKRWFAFKCIVRLLNAIYAVRGGGTLRNELGISFS